jgi:RNA polymerase primary sigma factor
VVRRATAKTVSLSASTATDGKELVDLVADPFVDTEEEATEALLPQEIEQLLGNLSPAAARVLKLRFGIGTGQARTTNDVAAMLSVSSERVRQIEARALSTLRNRITPMFWAS